MKSNLITLLIFTTFLSFVVFSSNLFAQKAKLRYQATPNTYKTIETINNQKIEQIILGQPQVINQQTRIVSNFEFVKPEIEDRIRFNMCFKQVSFKRVSPLGVTIYDSEIPADTVPDDCKGYAAMKGECITISVNDLGEIASIVGVEEMQKNMLHKHQLLSNWNIEALKQRIQQQFSVSYLRANIEAVVLQFPKEKIIEGYVWKQTVQLNAGIPLTVNTVFNVINIENDRIVIGVKSHLKTNKGSIIQNVDGSKLIYSLSGIQWGNIVINKQDGWLIESEVKQLIDGDILMHSQISSDITWSIKIHSTVNARQIGK